MIKRLVKDYFTFSFSERRGIIVLMSIILILIIFRIFYPLLIQNTDHESEAFSHEIDQWFSSSNDLKYASLDSVRVKERIINKKSLFVFNPNTISVDDLNRLDINDKVRAVWIRYLQKGGKFYRKEDMKKIYGMDSVTFERLRPFIYLNTDSSNTKISANNLNSVKTSLIEINNATHAEFKTLMGIGTVLSQRIIKYRNLLGGFIEIDQLGEVYGVNDTLINLNRNRLFVDRSQVKLLNLNKADYTTLRQHPYLSNYEAKSIMAYRELQGEILSVNDLINNNLISDSTLLKLTGYLSFEEE